MTNANPVDDVMQTAKFKVLLNTFVTIKHALEITSHGIVGEDAYGHIEQAAESLEREILSWAGVEPAVREVNA